MVRRVPFGALGIVWCELDGRPRVLRVQLTRRDLPAAEAVAELYPGARPGSCGEVETIAAGIRGFLSGDAVEFPLEIADLAACGEFQRRVLVAEHAIPRGMVSTYRLIAAHLGKPRGARAVGNALATNPFPLIVPCHRAIRSDGGLGGYQGGVAMKRALLELEGIPFDPRGRVGCPERCYGS